MKKSIFMALFAFVVAGLVMVASPSMAVHKGVGDLTCGNCHTMHSSQGGTSVSAMGTTTGSFILLRKDIGTDRTTIHNFCLQCHAETGAQGGDLHGPLDITAPKVWTTAGFTNGASFSTVGAGGDFSHVGAFDGSTYTPGTDDDGLAATEALGRGHSLGAATTVVPPGNTTDGTGVGAALGVDLSCTTCHDPHGTATTTDAINKFRNLKVGTSNAGANSLDNNTAFNNLAGNDDFAVSYAGGVGCVAPCVAADGVGMGTGIAAANNRWPVWLNAVAGNQNQYYQSDAAFDPTTAAVSAAGTYVGISLFCAQCHGAWHEELAGGNNVSGNDWKRHPVNNQLIDTGRRKLGVIIGDNVHTGIHTKIYPGRKIWPNKSTLPGEIVKKDIC